MAQLVKIASVCRLCGSSVAYTHHVVLLGKKKDSQERLASRISALLDIMLNDERWQRFTSQVCEVQAESWKFRDANDGPHKVKEVSGCEAIWTFIIVSWQVYYIESELWRHITWKNQKIARSPHILGRLNACANSVYQVLLRFSCAPGTRLYRMVLSYWSSALLNPPNILATSSHWKAQATKSWMGVGRPSWKWG